MVEDFIELRLAECLRRSVFGPYVDAITSSLVEAGYAGATVREHLRAAEAFGRWVTGFAITRP